MRLRRRGLCKKSLGYRRGGGSGLMGRKARKSELPVIVSESAYHPFQVAVVDTLRHLLASDTDKAHHRIGVFWGLARPFRGTSDSMIAIFNPGDRDDRTPRVIWCESPSVDPRRQGSKYCSRYCESMFNQPSATCEWTGVRTSAMPMARVETLGRRANISIMLLLCGAAVTTTVMAR